MNVWVWVYYKDLMRSIENGEEKERSKQDSKEMESNRGKQDLHDTQVYFH